MARFANSTLSRRLLLASFAFGLFVLCDIALFGWLIFRSLSQREVERVLLETKSEAEGLAQQIASTTRQDEDLFTAVATERETQTYIDSVLAQRELVRVVTVHDKHGRLVFKSRAEAEQHEPGAPPMVGSPELQSQVQREESVQHFEYEVPDIRVPIGEVGYLQIGISPVKLGERIQVLRQELARQAILIGVVTVVLLLTAYAAVWWLFRRSQRLEAQAAEAERLAYIGTLASGLAHEIRNPLNALNLNMQMLEEELAQHGRAPSGRRLLTVTRSEISRLERLVTDFLAYARPRALELQELPAVELLERVLEVLAGEIQRRGARVEIEEKSGGARVRVDPAQFRQLLLNLAQNALAATEESGRPPVLKLTATRRGNDVVLAVADNGVGIPPEEQGRIFELFYSTRKGGTGLGLAIVDRIARAHGGRVEVESAVGAGTTIAVAVPAAQAADPAVREWAAAEPSPPPPSRLGRRLTRPQPGRRSAASRPPRG